MRNDKGFSLIELLVVIAVILIIAAIAIPNFLSSRLRANETSAVASLRVINNTAVAYSITYRGLGFPAQLAAPVIASKSQACREHAALIELSMRMFVKELSSLTESGRSK